MDQRRDQSQHRGRLLFKGYLLNALMQAGDMQTFADPFYSNLAACSFIAS